MKARAQQKPALERIVSAYQRVPVEKREGIANLVEKIAEANDIVAGLFNDKKGSKEKIA